MAVPDDSHLFHDAAPYDPAKAHDYYLKNRKLHPRIGSLNDTGSYTVKSAKGTTYKISAEKLGEQKLYAAHRTAEIKANLKDLAVILKDKLEKAKASSKAAKPLTLAEKAKAARDSAAYAKAHKTEIAAKAKKDTSSKTTTSSTSTSKSTTKADTVDSVKADITSTKVKLKAAVAKQRTLATAKKNG